MSSKEIENSAFYIGITTPYMSPIKHVLDSSPLNNSNKKRQCLSPKEIPNLINLNTEKVHIPSVPTKRDRSNYFNESFGYKNHPLSPKKSTENLLLSKENGNKVPLLMENEIPILSPFNSITPPSSASSSKVYQPLANSFKDAIKEFKDVEEKSHSGSPKMKKKSLGMCGRKKFNSPMSAGKFSSTLHFDEETKKLRQKELSLDKEIQKYKKLVNTTRQALKYEHKNEDEKLMELEEKWRNAAQQAANYIYGQSLEKINRMGGVRVYREKQIEKKERLRKWQQEDDEFNVLSELEQHDISEKEKENILKDRRHAIEERLKEDKLEESKALQEKEEDTLDEDFTIKEFLTSMNIEYKTIFPEEDC